MAPLRVGTQSVAGALLVMVGLFVLVLGGVYLFYQPDSWPIGVISIVTSVVLFFLVGKHPRFDHWVEFGERLKISDFHGIHTREWSEVTTVAISENHIEGFSSTISIGCAETEWFSVDGDETYYELRDIVRILGEGLRATVHRTRERAAVALGKVGAVSCSDAVDSLTGMFPFCPSAVGLVKQEAIGHLQHALDDEHENVRKASREALREVYEEMRNAVCSLIDGMESEDFVIRQGSVGGLSVLVRILRGSFQSDSDGCVPSAAVDLKREATGRAVPALIRALADTDRYVRSTAVGALREIGTAEAVEALEGHQTLR